MPDKQDMILFPTLELRGNAGTGGLQSQLAVQAARLYSAGFRQFYFIDRNAQFGATAFDHAQSDALLEAYPDCTIWIGGGIKDLPTVERLAQTRAERIVLGPMFWQQPDLFAQAAQIMPERLLALVAARQGWIVDETRDERVDRALDLMLKLEEEGAAGILYLERDRAGFYGGIDAETMADLAFALRVPLFVTGGIHTLATLRQLREESATGLSGIVLGQALLDGRIDPVSALTLLAQKD